MGLTAAGAARRVPTNWRWGYARRSTRQMRDCCKTRYPIILVHGMNCRDERPIFYWGRIPDTLRERGARVWLGGRTRGARLPEMLPN